MADQIELPKTATKAELLALALKEAGMAALAEAVHDSVDRHGDFVVRRRVVEEWVDVKALLAQLTNVEREIANIPPPVDVPDTASPRVVQALEWFNSQIDVLHNRLALEAGRDALKQQLVEVEVG